MLNSKILILCTLPKQLPTGPGIVALNILNILRANFPSIQCLEYFSNGKMYSSWTKLFGSAKNKHSIQLGIFPFIWKLLIYRPKLIHILTFERVWIFAIIYKLFFKCKLIFTVHGCVIHEHTNYRFNIPTFLFIKDKFCEWLYFSFADKLHFVSENVYNISTTYYKINKSKIIIIPNPIENKIPNKLKPRNGNNIVFVGNSFRVEKGLSYLLASLQNIKTPVNVFIIGSTESKFNVNKNVSLFYIPTMQHEQFLKFISDKDILVSPSLADTFGLIIPEALNLNLHVIATSNCGAIEFIKNPNLHIIEFGDVLNLTELLIKLIKQKPVMFRSTFVKYNNNISDKLIELYNSQLIIK